MEKNEIAAKLKQARLNSKMTQKQVADILGMTYQAISNYERGRTKVESDILVKLCQIYDVSIHHILSDAPDGTKTETDNDFCIPDLRLQNIIRNYNCLTEDGKKILAAQAEFLLSKYHTGDSELKTG